VCRREWRVCRLREPGTQILLYGDAGVGNEVTFFAQVAEVLSDISAETDDVKMVFVGVAEDAAVLVGESQSLRRRITEIDVPRMSDAEIAQILENGFALLALTATSDAIARLIFFSDGFPYFAHELG
jgi:hypothetical protein